MTNKKIVVDIEWDAGSKMPSPTVLQIGAIKLDENRQTIDSFYSVIKPYNEISNMDLLNFIPTDVLTNILVNGREKNMVLNAFSEWCGDRPSFIIWGAYNQRVFESLIGDEVSLNTTIDLQLPLSLHFGEEILSLEKICEKIGIEITNSHHSLYDAQTLAALYKYVQNQDNLEDLVLQYYSDREERRGEKRREKRRRKRAKIRAMQKVSEIKYPYNYFVIVQSSEVHKKDCSALKDVSIDDAQGFQTLKNALKNSKKTCPLCFKGNINFHPALTAQQLFNLVELHALCYELELFAENFGCTYILNTPAGSWHFEIDTGHPILYHRNYVYDERNLQGALCGYHRQPVNLNSDKEVVLYIKKHDEGILKGNRRPRTLLINQNSKRND